ncbi:MAG: archease [Dehalococcoidia bacterium]|nr:archease [Dehalococcoidia bacterium]
MADFEVIEHTADIGIVAHGASVEDVFVNAARGMFSLMIDLDLIRESKSRDIAVHAPDLELLLAEWLSELLFLFEVEHVLFRRFQVELPAPGQLRGRVWGEHVDPKRHRIGLGIKAVTHHMLQIVKEDGYRASIIFDV